MNRNLLWVAIVAAVILIACIVFLAGRHPEWALWRAPQTGVSARGINIYRHIGQGDLSAAASRALERVYVPDIQSGDVAVIDPKTLKVVDRFKVGNDPQHVVPSWDMRTLWVTGSVEEHHSGDGSLTPIDPRTGKPGPVIPVPDAYNLYFTLDGRSAIVVAEQKRRLEFRDPHTMRLQDSLSVPHCAGINHADFSPDGRFAIFTCEFSGALAKIDMAHRRTIALMKLPGSGMPQDVRSSPDGKIFFVADMMADGVWLVDGAKFRVKGFVPTGVGTHGLCISRDGRSLYVSNRGSHRIDGTPHGPGSVSVIDFATVKVVHTWPIPGGGSPDMGNVSADGKSLWLSGRYDNVAYRFDTATGEVASVPVGREPHGLTIWPQPGRFSLGHTGNMR